MSSVAFLVSLAALGMYGFAIFYLATSDNLKKLSLIHLPELHKYGQLKFLTNQCLLFQFINALLHVGAYFVKSLEKPRDLFFTALAYPIGSVVVYSFWIVWHTMGREFIFPLAISEFFPDWLNHTVHSIIAPLNILLALLINHKYSKKGSLLTLAYMASYAVFILYVKHESGIFIYKYIEAMNAPQVVAYMATTATFAYLMYKSGQLLTSLVHSKATQRPSLKQKRK